MVTVASAASAQTDAVAESLFREGKKLLAEKKYDLACPKFAESARLAPSSGVELALGLCYEGEGKMASAWAAYSAVPALARKDARRDREEAANLRIAALEPKLARLTFEVPSENVALDGFELKQDGVVLGSAAWTGVPVDPGAHEIDVAAPGYRPHVVRLTISNEPGVTTVTIPALVPDASIATTHSATAGSAAPSSGGPSHVPGIVLESVGVASIVAGSIFGALSLSAWSSAKSACGGDPSHCLDVADGSSYRSTAETDATASTIALVAGGALVATGVVVLVRGAMKKSDAKTSWVVSPGVLPGQAGFVLAGSF